MLRSTVLRSLFAFILIPSFAWGLDLQSYFSQVEQQKKGPFGLNYLQGPSHRVAVNDGSYPSTILFQAAYRNDVARAMGQEHGFYLANLFTTNYYELMGEYVYGDAHGSHPVDHAALIARGNAPLGKAHLMLQSWVLEKYYVSQNPSSKIARSFALRGISGSEFEVEYANYFFHYYLSVIEDEFQFLPLNLLLQSSPVTPSKSLEEARLLISQSYDYFLARWGASDARVSRLFQIRNAIHNQLSPVVLDLIDRYVADFPYYQAEGHTYLFKIKDLLREYYRVDVSKIAEKARRLRLDGIAQVLGEIQSGGPQVGSLKALSQEVAALRTSLTRHQANAENKSDLLILLNESVQYIGKELNQLRAIDSVEPFETATNLLYIEGFLIEDNWTFLRDEVHSAQTPAAAAALIADVIVIATETLNQSLQPTLDKWISLEPSMAQVIDDKLKSSSVNTAALLTQKVSR